MIKILLAEDNAADVRLVEEALATHEIEGELQVVQDGQKALNLIAKIGDDQGTPCPDVMLLDINLPKADGPTVLAALRENKECSGVPVIVVTSSDDAGDRRKVARLGIAHYFRKPLDFDEFMKLGAVIKSVLPSPA